MRSTVSLAFTLLGLALALGSGCGDAITGEPPIVPKPFHYARDGELRLEHVQAMGTHNSYHLPPKNNNLLAWAYAHAPLGVQLDKLGVRQIELDVNWEADPGRFEVYHVALADEETTCRVFTDCLKEIKNFSDRYPGHLPLYLQIEPKAGFVPASAVEERFVALEKEIRSVFPMERIFTPAELQGSAPSLREAVAKDGWPALGKLRGKVIFAWDTSGDLRTAYTHGGQDLVGRLLFVDSAPTHPYAAVAVINDPKSDATRIAGAIAAHLLVRSRADVDGEQTVMNDRSQGEAALAAGAHFISTDYPTTAPGGSYEFRIPAGTPARCNPVTAPTSCTARDLEDPAFVGSGAM